MHSNSPVGRLPTSRRYRWRSGVCSLSLALTYTAIEAADQPPAPVPSVEAIVVTSQKLSVETLLDRKVYSIASDVQSTFGTLSDVLSNIPSIDVDPDGIVSLRGDTNVLILIDGKPSTQFLGASAGDALQSIPAKDIERIEVLNTPPAQFKADGAAGVINIVTRKKRPEGVYGSVQGSLGSGRRYVGGADASYNSGPLTVSATAGYRRDYRRRLVQSQIIASDPTTGALTGSESSANERIRRSLPTVSVSAGYALNDKQAVSASVSWDERGGPRTYTQLNSSTSALGNITSSSRRISSGRDPATDNDEKLGFTQTLAHPGETLVLSLHRSTSIQHEHYDYINDSFIPPAATFYNNLTFHEDHGTTEAGIDYELPSSKTRSLKLGYAFEQDDFRFGNIGNIVDPSTGAQSIDANLTNDFKFRQQIDAVYASYQTGIDAWTLLGGLRAELTHTVAQQLTDNVSTLSSYFSVYPSLHVAYNFKDDSTLSFGASRRVSRPDPDNLNPYIDHEYSPNLRAGNPHLRPQYTQSYEVGYGSEVRGRSYALTGYYRLNRDSVTDVTEYLGSGLSLTTKTNLPKNNSAGLEFTSNGRILPKLTYSVSGNFFCSQIDATALGASGLQSTTGLNAKLKIDYRPTTLDSAQISTTRTDKRLTPQGYVSAINIVNLGYKHQFLKELTAIATVSDVFNGQRFQRLVSSPTFTEVYRRTTRGRVFYLGLVYSFGVTKKDKQPNFEYDQSS